VILFTHPASVERFLLPSGRLSRRERFLAAGVGLLLLGLRVAAFLRYRFDSDEPQHLHVTWGWTQGLIQYRDVFDNHAPLFHIATAPWLALFGERADILFCMRALMIPIWLFVCAATFVVARRFYSTRAAVWSVLILNLFPTFFLKSIEYRTDNLWVAFWMAAFLVLTGGDLTKRRMFVVGLLLGAATSVSLKTSLLVATLLLAGVMIKPRSWRTVLPALLGLIIVPSIIALTFVELGAWRDLVYCNFTFNKLVSISRPWQNLYRVLYIPALIVIFYTVRDRILMISLVYTLTLACWWTLISPRDLLAILPMYAMLVAAWLDDKKFRAPALAALTLVSVLGLAHDTKRWKNDTREFTTMMDQVLHLTRPGEPLMDYKGETIYRRRPYYFIFETIGRATVQRGLIPDTIARDMINARCHVAQADGKFWPPDAKRFLLAHYVDLGRLRASGNWMNESGTFDVAIPGTYVVLDRNGQAHGTLDGVPYRGAVPLAPGIHHFERANSEALVWLWAPAYERGFSPFHLRDREF